MEREWILYASVNYKGIIINGHRHSDCYEILKKLRPDILNEDLPQREHQGFLTSENRFVSRKEAWIIANENKQIQYGKDASENGDQSQLISENLY